MDIQQRFLQWTGRLCLSLAMGLLVSGDSWAQTTVEPNLFPGDGVTEVQINTSLRWGPVDKAASYDVYFGQTERPPFQCRVAGPSFVLETLTAGKTYFWRVDVVSEAGVQTGKERRFKTASKADRDALYAWPIRIAHSVRSLYPDATRLGNWNYTEGMIIDALYSIASRTGREDDFNYIRQWLDRFVTAEGGLDPKAYPFTLFSLDRIRPAPALLWMYERTGEKKYLQAAQYVATQLDKQPRTSDGGYWHRSTYPNQMWLGPEYLEHALRATRGVLNHRVDLLPDNRMDIRGTVQVGSLGGNGGFYDYYVSVPVVTNDPKALGAFMYLSLVLSDTANDTGPAGREFPRRSP